jgi:hypothetical protein
MSRSMNYIDIIKTIRIHTNLSLKEAKDLADNIRDTMRRSMKLPEPKVETKVEVTPVAKGALLMIANLPSNLMNEVGARMARAMAREALEE